MPGPFDPPPPGNDAVGEALRAGPERAERRLVLLHGWGADADDLLDLGIAVAGPGVSVVALRAPLPHPMGMGRQWYDLRWTGMEPEPAWEQVPAARAALRVRLEALGAAIPLERTALLGFSQGAAMAVDAALGGAEGGERALPVAAVIACSGYPHREWRPMPSRSKVLLTHGEQDPVVAAEHSRELETRLRQAGVAVERLTFPGGHGIDPAALPVIGRVLEHGWQG